MWVRSGSALEIQTRARLAANTDASVWARLVVRDRQGKRHTTDVNMGAPSTTGTLNPSGSPGIVEQEGELDSFQCFLTPSTGAIVTAQDRSLVSSIVTDGSGPVVGRGQLAVVVHLNGIPLCQGYLWQGKQALGLWEFGELGPAGGPGYPRVVTGANPAAQTEASDAVPADAVWRLIAYQIQIVGIAADTAAPRLIVETPTRVRKFIGGLQDAIAGAETQTFVWGQGFGNFTLAAPTPFSDTEQISPRFEIPNPLYLAEGDILRTLTSGVFGATSNYGAPSITVEEWLVI